MLYNSFISIIENLQGLSNEWIGILMGMTSLGALWLLHYCFGKEGIYLFSTIAVILANIQSLKAIKLAFFDYPIAMGTLLFTGNLLAIDILAEYYGQKEAEKGIWLGFAGVILVGVVMIFTLGTKVMVTDASASYYEEVHKAMALIFTPMPTLFLASLLSYIVSQYIDMTFFLQMKVYTKGRFLGFRTFLALLFSALVDNSLFNLLAWKVFYPLPISSQTFLFTYMIGTFGLRVVISSIYMPFIYVIRRKNQRTFQ